MSAFPRVLRRMLMLGGALAPAAALTALLGAPGALAAPVVQASPLTAPVVTLDFGDALPSNPDLLRQMMWIKSGQVPAVADDGLRVATFSAGLSRSAPEELAEDLSEPGDPQGMQVAETVQRAAPDVVLLTDMDVDAGEDVAQSFRTNYLAVGTGGQSGIDYPYMYVSEVNNGVDTGADLDDDGIIGGSGDAFGPGDFAGQHGMVLYSKHPLDTDGIRTFTELPWASMPDNAIPEGVYSDLELSVLRLSSTAHWDIPVTVDGQTVHILAAQPSRAEDGPTGAERHHDEMRFWADYLAAGTGQDAYIVDDEGQPGGLPGDAPFVLAGDFGPLTGTALSDTEHPSAVAEMLASGLIQDPLPVSQGAEHLKKDEPAATEVVSREGGEWALARSDYLLPSSTITTTASGVFWPVPGQLGSQLTRANAPGGELGEPNETTPSEHRLVWTDLDLSGGGTD
ncbi:endonuclease/exonuclease/phosphatase family protein [Citricoccus sp. NPDC055426]|uniref:endonuclease/exonuclease/phosphatase family protein n=1 Tax=Citricoccus sp. NPDC055426 TaxID=3155536 RepID=UPI00341E6A76